MKILWICRKYFDVALDKTTWIEMIKHLEKNGNNVRLLTGYKEGKRDYGIDIKYIPSVKRSGLNYITFSLFGYFYLLYNTIKYKPDFIILDFWTFWMGFPFDFLSKFRILKLKYIVDYRTFYFGLNSNKFSFTDKILELQTRISLNYSKYFHSGISVIVSELEKYFRNLSNIKKEHICIWSSGVSLEYFNQTRYKNIKLFSNDSKDFIIFFHGAFSNNRGLLKVIKSFKYIDDKNIKLVFVGDGPLRDKMFKMKYELNLSKRIIIKGPISYKKIPVYLKAADVGIMAYPAIQYWNVNNPIKMLEYLAMGKPIIIRNIPSFRKVIKDKPCGIFIDSNSPKVIAEAIMYTYKNRNKLSEWGKIGRKIIKERYTWEAQAKKLNLFLNTISK